MNEARCPSLVWRGRHKPGYKIKEIIGSQADNVSFLKSMLASGTALFDDNGEVLPGKDDASLEKIIAKPHIVYMSGDFASRLTGSWFASIFDCPAPRIGLAPSQQRLLLAASKSGGTDHELAAQLGISLTAVKKAWESIYERAAPFIPQLGRDVNSRMEGRRGSERRRHVLQYMNGHMEELRPSSANVRRSAG
jgi:hypothetical protein